RSGSARSKGRPRQEPQALPEPGRRRGAGLGPETAVIDGAVAQRAKEEEDSEGGGLCGDPPEEKRRTEGNATA
ncbi:hypothetical protein U0070_014446, partial [Myodes glareolus]